MVTTLQEKQIQAQSLQKRGLLRRALAIWNEIARHDDSELAPIARQKQQEIAALLAQQKVERGSEIPLPLPCRRRSAMDYDSSA
jgi:hypothetical protein